MEYKSRKQEILETISVGDEVVVNEHTGRYASRPRIFATVTKITKTQITLSNGIRYLLSDGEELGSKNSRYGSYISFENVWGTNNKPLTLTTRAQAEEQNAEILAERDLRIKRVKLNNAFSSLTLSLQQIEEIARVAGFEL